MIIMKGLGLMINSMVKVLKFMLMAITTLVNGLKTNSMAKEY